MNGILFGLLLVGAVYLAWRDSMRARERAISFCRNLCSRHQVQFLDDTVALTRLRVRRDPVRGLKLHRVYEFEFSTEGQSRSLGSVILTGDRIDAVHLPGITSYLEH
ncbi:MAG TPA: DUF3301 domain-containing protein [Gammaproteobacteria bacterium]|nr:DUF3301 domain-containing protein [Gammaproteobacteria bacterium]